MSGPSRSIPLDSVIITEELAQRPVRASDEAAVNRALVVLAQTMANSPDQLLQKLTETALDVCHAHTCGLSLLEEENGKAIFRWHGVAGRLAAHYWGTTPRDFSPCGTVLDTDAVQLMLDLDRHFQYFADVQPRIIEALLVPFRVNGTAVGTIWVISHDYDRKFDAEDLRVLKIMGEFAAAAFQLVSSVNHLKTAQGVLEEQNRRLVRVNSDLKRTEADLRLANSDLEQFRVAASHDLQEPLRTIVAYTQLLREQVGESANPEMLKTIATVVDGAARMHRLIDDLLHYTQLDLMDTETRRPLPLSDAAQGAIANLAALIEDQKAHVNVGALPLVFADMAQMTLLMQNLISNAIKYRSPARPPIVDIAAERGPGEWIVSVRDNGQGFPPRHAEDIFRIFRRLHGKDVPGTGIGLALCQRIVQRRGGTIRADSEPGTGSTFTFTLPILDHAETLA